MPNLHAGRKLFSGEELTNFVNTVAGNGVTGPTGPVGPTGPAPSNASPTFTGTTTVGGLTATGIVKITNLPTADPHVAGQLWASAGTVTVSAG